MQVSKQDLPPRLFRKLHRSFCHVIADIRTANEAEDILHELLSETERVAIMKRLGIAVFLDQGMSYDKIKNMLKVSSATIASVQERMGRPGLQNAIEKVTLNTKADEWAEKISRLLPFLGKKQP